MQEKIAFEKEYFCKTFKGFFNKKITYLIESEEKGESIVGILDIQSSVKELFFKSVRKQLIERAIKEELTVTLRKIYEQRKKNQRVINKEKQLIFLQIYCWLLESNSDARRKFRESQIEQFGKILNQFKFLSQFEGIGAAQDFFDLCIRQLSTLGKFPQSFKYCVIRMAENHDFEIEHYSQILRVPIKTPLKVQEDIKIKPQKVLESAEKKAPGKASITSLQSHGKSSQNKSSICSPQRAVGRTVFISHPMRFKVQRNEKVKIITEYVSKEELQKNPSVQLKK